jgi:hypothetical protein
MAEIKSESVAGFIPESVADFLRNQQPSAQISFAGMPRSAGQLLS